MAHLETGSMVTGLRLHAELAYVATLDAGVLVLDVLEPAAPIELGVLAPGLWAPAIALGGERLFVTAPGEDLHVYGLEDPARPELLRRHPGVGGHALAVAGEHLYVAAGLWGEECPLLRIFALGP